jgi:hypothetical protein
MQSICRYCPYCRMLTSICKICKVICKICKICKHDFNMQNMHSPLCWWSNQCCMNWKYMCAAWRFRITTWLHWKGMIYCQTGYTRYIPGICHVYTMHIPCEGHFLAFLVAHPRLEASDLDFLRIFSILATERPPTRGWGRPKFHSQVLIS